jgi:hypothetical protein
LGLAIFLLEDHDVGVVEDGEGFFGGEFGVENQRTKAGEVGEVGDFLVSKGAVEELSIEFGSFGELIGVVEGRFPDATGIDDDNLGFLKVLLEFAGTLLVPAGVVELVEIKEMDVIESGAKGSNAHVVDFGESVGMGVEVLICPVSGGITGVLMGVNGEKGESPEELSKDNNSDDWVIKS